MYDSDTVHFQRILLSELVVSLYVQSNLLRAHKVEEFVQSPETNLTIEFLNDIITVYIEYLPQHKILSKFQSVLCKSRNSYIFSL